MKIRLLIADDHDLVREGLRGAFHATDIEVVGEASSGEEAIRLALDQHYDVMLLDVSLPDKDGFMVLAEVKAARPELPVTMYSNHDREDFKARARQLGAGAYLTKTVRKRDLLTAVRAVSQGKQLWHPAIEEEVD